MLVLRGERGAVAAGQRPVLKTNEEAVGCAQVVRQRLPGRRTTVEAAARC